MASGQIDSGQDQVHHACQPGRPQRSTSNPASRASLRARAAPGSTLAVKPPPPAAR